MAKKTLAVLKDTEMQWFHERPDTKQMNEAVIVDEEWMKPQRAAAAGLLQRATAVRFKLSSLDYKQRNSPKTVQI